MICDIWKQIVSLDVRYANKRKIIYQNPKIKKLYLLRRNQLNSEKHCFYFPKDKNVEFFEDVYKSQEKDAFSRTTYLVWREQLLRKLYGPVSKPKSSSSQIISYSRHESVDESFRQSFRSICSLDGSMSDYKCNNICDKVETFGDSYAFSGIDHIFDHHLGAINRICFANLDSTRLALASADGTISICRAGSLEKNKTILCTLSKGHVQPTQITDIAWSMTNEFLISTALDGNICLWDVNEAKLARFYSGKDLKLGPLLVCKYQPANYNFLVVGGISVIQVVNLSTGKLTKKGKDKVNASFIEWRKSHVNEMDLNNILGSGCITALDFENASGTYLWVGTDQGIIQTYQFNVSTGELFRSRRFDISNMCRTPRFREDDDLVQYKLSFNGTPSNGCSTLLNKSIHQPQKKRKSLHFTGKSIKSIIQEESIKWSKKLPTPSITSISIHSWVAKEKSETYILINAAGVGLLLFQLLTTERRLILRKRFPIKHNPKSNHSATLKLLHSSFAPLISFRSGACVVTGCEDCNVYLYNILTNADSYPERCNEKISSTNSKGVVTVLQGHTAPVLDVAISWDENVLASADEKGAVILWRRN